MTRLNARPAPIPWNGELMAATRMQATVTQYLGQTRVSPLRRLSAEFVVGILERGEPVAQNVERRQIAEGQEGTFEEAYTAAHEEATKEELWDEVAQGHLSPSTR